MRMEAQSVIERTTRRLSHTGGVASRVFAPRDADARDGRERSCLGDTAPRSPSMRRLTRGRVPRRRRRHRWSARGRRHRYLASGLGRRGADGDRAAACTGDDRARPEDGAHPDVRLGHSRAGDPREAGHPARNGCRQGSGARRARRRDRPPNSVWLGPRRRGGRSRRVASAKAGADPRSSAVWATSTPRAGQRDPGLPPAIDRCSRID
jgi:hypothetical protein